MLHTRIAKFDVIALFGKFFLTKKGLNVVPEWALGSSFDGWLLVVGWKI